MHTGFQHDLPQEACKCPILFALQIKEKPLNSQEVEKRESSTRFSQARNDAACPGKCRETALGNKASCTVFTPHLSHRGVIFVLLSILNEMSLCSLWDI